MFNNRKEINKRTGGDVFLLKIQDEIHEAKFTLEAAARKVIICIGVVDLYPEGADKDLARQDAEKAKLSLRAAIGVYDRLVSDYQSQLRTYPKEERTITCNWTYSRFDNSHKIVEEFYEGYWKSKK